MSLGYADRLSFEPNLGGQLGAPELQEPDSQLQTKLAELARLVSAATRVVVFTGAGISTSTGIPDFRGPNGIWTLRQARKPLPPSAAQLATAVPSLTHQVLLQLVRTGKVPYIVTQNVDALHRRSGVPEHKLAELHGCCFIERCPSCKHCYVRDWEVETVGFKPTGRRCTKPGCSGRLTDWVLDWESALPEDLLQEAERQTDAADLCICLGTSLQIQPVNLLPERTLAAGGKLVIVNLQETDFDLQAEAAGLVIHAKTDQVLQDLAHRLQQPIPSYTRTDRVAWACTWTLPEQATKRAKSGARLEVKVHNAQVFQAPIAIVSLLSVTFPGQAGLKATTSKRAPLNVLRACSLDSRPSFELSITLDTSAVGVNRLVTFTYTLPLDSQDEEQPPTSLADTAQPAKRLKADTTAPAQCVSTQEQHFWSLDRRILSCSGVLAIRTQHKEYACAPAELTAA